VQNNRVFVLGVAGGTCSGKTTLARRVVELLADRATLHLRFDSYYRPINHLPLEERHRQNFDHPQSLEHELYAAHLASLRTGQGIERPVYDFATHSRRPETDRLPAAEVVVADGILLLAYPEVREQLDLSVFLDVPEAVRLGRRVARDQVERGRSEESVRRQFAESVAPMHTQFVQPGAGLAGRVIAHPFDIEPAAVELAGVVRTHLCET
jgi:uridine kinase